jgi:hypothetical protein
MLRIIAAVSLLVSTSAFALESLEEFGDTVCCVDTYYCAPISEYQWRRVKGGVELMTFKNHWCRVELLRSPLKLIFDGQPADPCGALLCFSPPKR